MVVRNNIRVEIGGKIKERRSGDYREFISDFLLQQLAIYDIINMKFERLLTLVGELPFFETGLLPAGDVDSVDVKQPDVPLSAKRAHSSTAAQTLHPRRAVSKHHPASIPDRKCLDTRLICQRAISTGVL
jgi:hypothetical protein